MSTETETITTSGGTEWIVLEPEELSRAAKAFQQHFGDNLIGQDNASRIALSAYERSKNKLRDKTKPIGIYVLIGPSRSGKSKTGKVMAKFIHGREDAITIIEAGDYIEKHQMLDLTGASPTYVGYVKPSEVKALNPQDVDGTSKVSNHNRRRVRLGSNSEIDIVMLNEFEKSTDDFYRYWMGVFDNGFSISGNSMKQDFSNTIFILTMNLGMEDLAKFARGRIGFNGGPRKVTEADVKEIVDGALKAKYKREFLNRLSSVVVFRPLTEEDLLKICGIEVRNIQERIKTQLEEREQFNLEVTESAQKLLVKQSLTDEGDAAELTRVVERELADKLGRELDKRTIRPRDSVLVDCPEGSDKLVFKVEKRKKAGSSTNLPAVRKPDPSTWDFRLDDAMTRVARREVPVDLFTITFMDTDEDELVHKFSRLQQELRELFEIDVVSMYLHRREPFAASVTIETSLEMAQLIRERYRTAQITLAQPGAE